MKLIDIPVEIGIAYKNYRRYFRISAGIFGISFLLGFIAILNSTYHPLLEALFSIFPGRSGTVKLTFVSIFTNNLWVMFLILTGTFLLGTTTFALEFINGVAIGAIVAVSFFRLGPVATILFIAPHGILELPALWLAGGVGFGVTHKLFTGIEKKDIRHAIYLVFFSVFLLAVAAFIEVYVTGEAVSVTYDTI